MATIKDVAKMAGVSPSTVSRTLSGKIPVDSETRERVMNCVRQLDYRPNVIAKGLREGDTITAVQGFSVRTIDELNIIKNQYQAGDELDLTVFRGGESFTLNVILGEAAG